MAITATDTRFHWGTVGERLELSINKSTEQLAREAAGEPVATFIGSTVTFKFGPSTATAPLIVFAAGSGLTVLSAEQDSMKVQIATYPGWYDRFPEPAGSRVLAGKIYLQLANGQLQVEDVELTVLSSF